MASTRLTRTTGAGNRQKWTWSGWIKRNNISYGDAYLMGVYVHGADHFRFYFPSTDQLHVKFYNNTSYELLTNRRFRDTNAWYHIVLRVDNTQSTASNRFRLYVNGEQETSFATENQPTQNLAMSVNDSNLMEIGSYNNGGFFEGCMAHVNFVDGQALAPTEFGETDTTTGIWKPKTAPSVTYGTNGYFLKFENSASMGTDSAGSNNFTVSGTMTQLIDTPSNVFATLNPLDNFYGNTTLTEGNNTFNQTASSGNHTFIPSTLGFSSGKWYWEMKCVSNSSNSDMWYGTGITSNSSGGDNHYLGSFTNDYGVFGYSYSSGKAATYTGGTRTDQGTSFATGDIIGVAVDCDNLAMYVHKNGVYMPDASSVTGVPTSGASRTGALFDITAPSSTTKGFYFPALNYYDDRTVVQNINFGNGYFGTTAVSSAQNPDDGIGIFEYDVPAGYRALCTKSINAEEYS